MIIFDKSKYVMDIMRNGVAQNDANAYGKLFMVAKYLIEKTTYKPSVIKRNLKKYACQYFDGLSDEIINKEIESIYNRANDSKAFEEKKLGTNSPDDDLEEKEHDFLEVVDYFEPRKVTLYENEMKRISELDKNLQELAFAFLVVNKFQGYKWTYECNSDIYRICHWDEKGKGKSQTTKDNMIHKLVENEVLLFYCLTNKRYNYDKSWIAKTSFTVLINEDNLDEEKRSSVWNVITNYDDVLLYWKLYQNVEGIKQCEKCNAPIADTGNSKRFCSKCALDNIRESKRRNMERALNRAS